MPSQPRMPTQAEMLADAQLLADLDLPTEFSMLSENEPDEDLPDIPNVRLDPLTASEVEKQQSSPGRDKQPAAPPSSQPTDYQIPDSSQAPPEPQDSPDDPYQALATRFTEFLTVAIHTILYERNIYPRNSFLSARKYNFHVRQNRHPEVCGWITNAVKAVHVELLKGALYRVAVLIFSPDSVPVERFIFDVSGFPSPPRSKTSLHSISYGTIEDLEEELRASMLKISLCSAQLAEIPDDCSFTICIELKDEAGAPLGRPQAWIPTRSTLQPPNSRQKSRRKPTDLGGVRTTPIRTVDSNDFFLEMWIEECKVKNISSTVSGSVGGTQKKAFRFVIPPNEESGLKADWVLD